MTERTSEGAMLVRRSGYLLAGILVLTACLPYAAFPWAQSANAKMDRDLEEVTITRLQSMYASGQYTVTQVTQWYLDRIARYDDVYKALVHVDSASARTTAAAEDAAKKSAGSRFRPGPLWGVPIVIKANTSVKGLVTSNGWEGYVIPAHELVATADATIVAKLKSAG